MPISASLMGAFHLHLAGHAGEAEKICITALHSDRGNAGALHLMGHIAASRGQYDAATAFIARAIGTQPGRGDFHAGMGNVFAARNLHEGVRESYRRALLRTYFSAMPASLEEIFSHAGRDTPPENFSANIGFYKSQSFQDIVLDRWMFEGARDGVFVDIGAADGVSFSNSYFFEKERGWRGLCIEPNREDFARLERNRECAVRDCTVDGHNLNAIAGEHGICEITYLSVGTHGRTLAILQSVDFEKLNVHALTTECHDASAFEPMRAGLSDRGFAFARRLGHDLLFVHRESPAHLRLRKLQADRLGV